MVTRVAGGKTLRAYSEKRYEVPQNNCPIMRAITAIIAWFLNVDDVAVLCCALFIISD